MALGTARVPQGGQHLLRQLKEPQLVGDGRLALAQPPGQLLLGQGKVLLQPPQGQGLLPEVQIPALEVFHQGEQGGGLAVGLNGQTGDLLQARQLGRPQAALPRHQLPAVLSPADCEGLEQPQSADGAGQLLQLGLGELSAGLARIGRNILHRQKQHPPAVI